MGDGFWSRPPAPNYVSPGIIKRPHVESDGNSPRESFTVGMVHVGLHAAKDTKAMGTSYDQHLRNLPSFSSAAVGNLGRAGLAMDVGETQVEEAPDSAPRGLGVAFGGHINAGPESRAAGAEAQPPVDATNT